MPFFWLVSCTISLLEAIRSYLFFVYIQHSCTIHVFVSPSDAPLDLSQPLLGNRSVFITEGEEQILESSESPSFSTNVTDTTNSLYSEASFRSVGIMHKIFPKS